jgi:predicted transcriptional regulator
MIDISGPLEWAWKMIKWIVAILLIIIVIMGYKIYKNSQEPQPCVQAEECIKAEATAKAIADQIAIDLSELEKSVVSLEVNNALNKVFAKIDYDLTLNDVENLDHIPQTNVVIVTLSNGNKIPIGYFTETGEFKTSIKQRVKRAQSK